MFKLCAASSLAAVLTTSSALAVTMVIDDFDGAVRVGADAIPGFIEAETQFGGTGILGGFRDIAVTTTGGFVATDIEVDGTGRPSAVAFSNNARTTGTFTFTWDGDDSPLSLDTMGLGGLDMTSGGVNDRFAFEVLSSDLPGTPFQLSIWDMVGGMDSVFSSSVDVVNFGDTPQTLAFDFASYGGVDLTNVGAIQLFYQSTTAQDMSFDSLRADTIAPIPLPASALLLFGGLGGLAMVRKSRSKAS